MKRLALLSLVVLAGCKEPRTELIIGIATDLRATQNLDSVVLQLSVEGVPFHEETWTITGSPGADFNLPGSFGIYKDGEHERVQIKLTGLKNGAPIVTRDAVLGFIDGKTSFYRMGLTASCMTNTCPSGQTCVEGVCKAPDLDTSMFPGFSENLVTQLTCSTPGTPMYLDTATGAAMPLSANAAACPGNLCSEGTCLVPPSGNKTFKGVIVGTAVLDFDVDGAKLTGTVFVNNTEGAAGRFKCNGTVDGARLAATCEMNISLSGMIEGNRATGTATDPDGSPAAFTALSGSDVLRYCGTFAGSESGAWSFVTGGGKLTGTFDSLFVGGTLEGSVSGSNVQMAWSAGSSGNGTATGTITADKTRIMGTYTGTASGTSVNGTFTNDQASCADRK